MNYWVAAYVALGSNLGAAPNDPQKQIETAFTRLGQLDRTKLIARSRLYNTPPMGPKDQPDFVNAAAGLLTQLGPRELLAALKGIESEMGRQPPPVRWGPRIIDLDLLMHGSTVMQEPTLTLPHPGMHQRDFVLYPLADIAPTLRIPGHGLVSVLKHREPNVYGPAA